LTDDSYGRVDREGIHIQRDLADDLGIEHELDSNVVGPYRFPSPMRRRISGWVYVAGGVVVLVLVDGGWPAAVGFVALGLWQFGSAWPLNIDEHQALEVAGAAVPFPVGHASAAVTFRGLRSRPRWSVVLYSASEPPDQRGLVVIDAVSGEISEDPYVETVPEV
jgi:hypothetical protein